MKTKKAVIVLSAIVIIALLFFSFKSNPEKVNFQYLTVFSIDGTLVRVILCIDGKEYKKLNLSAQTKGPWDMNPLINLIHQYENEGWELMGLQSGESPHFNMRKESN